MRLPAKRQGNPASRRSSGGSQRRWGSICPQLKGRGRHAGRVHGHRGGRGGKVRGGDARPPPLAEARVASGPVTNVILYPPAAQRDSPRDKGGRRSVRPVHHNAESGRVNQSCAANGGRRRSSGLTGGFTAPGGEGLPAHEADTPAGRRGSDPLADPGRKKFPLGCRPSYTRVWPEGVSLRYRELSHAHRRRPPFADRVR
jgi:hypothetical protein